MPARLQDTLRMVGKQIHDLTLPRLPALNAEQRTRLTWARSINSYDSIPEVYKDFLAPHLVQSQSFPYTVLTPAYEALGHKVTEKLVSIFDDELRVLERNGKTLLVQSYPLAGISYVEVSSMLLDSQVRISGITSEGIHRSTMFRFNTTTDYVIDPILRKIRMYSIVTGDADNDSGRETFEDWMDLNYKFMNLARSSVLDRDKVIHAILQPEIREAMFTILGKTFFRTISPTHTGILTDRELILIREEVLQGREDKYGGIWEYIPLNKIADLSVTRNGDHLLVLSARLITNEQFECLFQSSKKNEVDQFLDTFRKMKSNKFGCAKL